MITIPKKFTFTVRHAWGLYRPVFTATKNPHTNMVDVEWQDEFGKIDRVDYHEFNVEQFLTPNDFNASTDWIIQQIIEA